eukprot:3871477-Prymnesium_polylepis.1
MHPAHRRRLGGDPAAGTATVCQRTALQSGDEDDVAPPGVEGCQNAGVGVPPASSELRTVRWAPEGGASTDGPDEVATMPVAPFGARPDPAASTGGAAAS